MYKTFRVFLVLLIIISFNTQMIYYGYAQPTVQLVIDPDIREIDISKLKEIKIFAKEITQAVWSLDGPGQLKGEEEKGKIVKGLAIIYILPGKIDGKLAKATVAIKPIDESEKKVTEVTFTLVAPAPEFKGTSTGTKVALGAVAVAALGGGIALAVAGGGNGGGDGDGSCGGVKVGGYCWYLGGWYIPCSSVCADHGGYNEATRTYAGSSGTDQNCWDVLAALGVPAATYRYQIDERADGCSYIEDSTGVHWVRSVLPTTAEAMGWNRACACNE